MEITDHLGIAFHFPDMGQVPELAAPKTRAQELLASWLDTEDAKNYNSGDFADQLPDLQLLDDDFFQFATADFGVDSTLLSSLLPPHKSSDIIDHDHVQSTTTQDACGFLLDNAAGKGAAHEPPPPPVLVHSSASTTGAADDAYHPTLPDTCCFAEQPPPPKYSSNADSDSSPLISDSDCMFLADDFYLIAPNDSFDGDTLLGNSVSAAAAPAASSSSTSTAAARKPEATNAAAGATAVPAIAPPNKIIAREDKEEAVEEEEEEDQEEVAEKEEPKPGTANCKNLVSERNRRKRLSQQLLALRALVPNITKMDKRSVLVDALAYLRSIHEETARIQAELKERARSSREPTGDNDPDPNQPQQTPPPSRIAKPKAQILEIDTEKIEERRFAVKMTCKGESGVGAEVLRVIESLGFEITYTAIEQLKPQHVLTTVFIRVRRQGRMTEDKLKDCITSTALRSGLTFPNP